MGGGAGGNFGNTKGSRLDTLSDLLTWASLLPVVDSFVDLAAIPVDFARGDYLSVGLDVLGAIPIVGEVADTAKLAKVANKAVDGAKVASKVSDAKKVKTINKQKRGTPRNNRAQNRQTKSVSKKLGLTPKQQRELHDLIHGENLGYKEILEYAKEWFNK